MRTRTVSGRERMQAGRDQEVEERRLWWQEAVAGVLVAVSLPAAVVAMTVRWTVRSWGTWGWLLAAAGLFAGVHIWWWGGDAGAVAGRFFVWHREVAWPAVKSGQVMQLLTDLDGWRLLVSSQVWLFPLLAVVGAGLLDVGPDERPVTARSEARLQKTRKTGKAGDGQPPAVMAARPRRRRRLPDRVRGRGVLGSYLAGDLPGRGRGRWVTAGWVTPPMGTVMRGGVIIGQPGAGKTTGTLTLADLAWRAGMDVIFVDCKGDDGLASRFVAGALTAGCEAGEVRLWPAEPYNIWTGSGKQVANRLLRAASDPTIPRYFRTVMQDITYTVCGSRQGPPRSATEFMDRAERYVRAARDRAGRDGSSVGRDGQTVLTQFRGLFAALADADGNLHDAGAPGGRDYLRSFDGPFDGDWTLDDQVRAALFTLPGLGANDETGNAGRLLLAEIEGWAAARKPRDRQVLLIVDELGTLGAGATKDLMERVRGFNVGLWVSGQTLAGLGPDGEAVLQAAAITIMFRTGKPQPIIELAGTVDADRAAWQIDQAGLTGTGTVAEARRAKIDANHVRSLRDGHAVIITEGRHGYTAIRMPAADQRVWQTAEHLVAARTGILTINPADVTEDGWQPGDVDWQPAADDLFAEVIDVRPDVDPLDAAEPPPQPPPQPPPDDDEVIPGL